MPLPAGVAVNSPWLDIVQSMPSWERNRNWDYLPPPKPLGAKQPPPDDIWPAKPPRKHLYVEDDYMLHPLVSLQLNASWKGSPPIYMCTGWECLADEDRYLASKLNQDGVTTVFEEYEAMPHVFAVLFPRLEEARRCLTGWSRFIVAATEDPERIQTSYTTIKAKTIDEINISVDGLTKFSEKDVRDMAYGRLGMKTPVPETLAKL